MVGTLAEEKKDTTGFGKRLRDLRLAAGLTQEGLGEMTGMHHQNVARLERGDRGPSWKTVIKLAEALGVTPDAFLQPNEDRPEEPADGTENDHRDAHKPRPRGK